jgi:hypothetical protein
VGDGHLRHAAHEQKRDERADQVAKQHRRAGKADGGIEGTALKGQALKGQTKH